MAVLLTPQNVAVGAFIALTIGYSLYQRSLPRPIPGIPHKSRSANRLLGDVPDIIKYQKATGDLYGYFYGVMAELGSPVVQAWPRPLGDPWVAVADFHEARDIMTRRTREFDRSKFFGDLFSAIVPYNHVGMPSGDTWKAHRRLINDTMSTNFLNDFVAQEIWSSTQVHIKFWQEKARLAGGHPFSAATDINKAALESIWSATFGAESGSTKAQLDLLSGLEKLDAAPSDPDSPVEFPAAKDSPSFTSILTLTESMIIPLNSPVNPTLIHRLALRFIPKLNTALRRKNQYIIDRLREASVSFSSADKAGQTQNDKVRSALDLIVQKEMHIASKENRPPQYDTRAIQDELFGFLVAGHDTSGTAISWALKFLTAYPEVQAKVREELRSNFKEAFESDLPPSAQEIADSNLTYLDATIWETLRCGTTAALTIRVALVDTQILGHHIPKGTDVVFLNSGPGYLKPAMEVDESKREAASREMQQKIPAWDNSRIQDFDPDRWLKKDEKGNIHFDSRAGPSSPFGAGPRGCFGQKLALLSLKMVLSLIVWNFELLDLPEDLASFKPVDKLTHMPELCYLRLKRIT